MSCEATHPLLRPMNWTCTGDNLSIVMMGPHSLPMVCPTDRLDELSESYAQVMADNGGPHKFTGGDHWHVSLPLPLDDLLREIHRITVLGARSDSPGANVMADMLRDAMVGRDVPSSRIMSDGGRDG